jgi:hypothetical protein
MDIYDKSNDYKVIIKTTETSSRNYLPTYRLQYHSPSPNPAFEMNLPRIPRNRGKKERLTSHLNFGFIVIACLIRPLLYASCILLGISNPRGGERSLIQPLVLIGS